jgi:hypothetical protein
MLSNLGNTEVGYFLAIHNSKQNGDKVIDDCVDYAKPEKYKL